MEWRRDYKTYGIIHGVSMDCKANSNRLGMPLLTISGRTNNRNIATFSMAIIPCEMQDAFVDVLKKHKSVIPVSPAVTAVDQSMA